VWPHIDVSVLARGLLQRLVTRIYFPDEVEANAVRCPDAATAERMIARIKEVAGD